MSAPSMYSIPDEDMFPAKMSTSSAPDEDEFVAVPHPMPDSLSFAVESGGMDEETTEEIRSGLKTPTPAKGMVWGHSRHRALSSTTGATYKNTFIIFMNNLPTW